MLNYYAKRAPRYERIYTKPERRGGLAQLKARVHDLTRGTRVLDLACGIGLQAEPMTNARSIVYADYNDTMPRVARGKDIAGAPSVRADNDALPFAPGAFDVMTTGYWWSHVPLQHLHQHVERLHRALGPDVRVLWFDNLYVFGSNTPIAYSDQHGNTWQRRPLRDDSEHDVLKSFPDDPTLLQTMAGIAQDVYISRFQYCWTLEYFTNQ